eukprot:gene8715-661_t
MEEEEKTPKVEKETNENQKEQKYQVFISDIPRGTTEDIMQNELQKYVKIKEISIAKNKKTGETKGYGFATLYSKEDLYALIDLKETPIFVDNITHKKFAIKLSIADPKNCLYISKIPKKITQLEIENSLLKFGKIEFEKFELSTTSSLESKGFGWVTYSTHEIAMNAFRNLKNKLMIEDTKIQVNFAESRVIDERIMNTIKVLYVKNLPESIQELQMIQLFGGIDIIEKAIIPFDKGTFKPQGHAFVHYKDRKDAMKYLNEMNGYKIDGKKIVVELSIPQSIVKSKKKSNEKKVKKGKQDQPIMIPQYVPMPFVMPIPFPYAPIQQGNVDNSNIFQMQQQQQQLYNFMYQQQFMQQQNEKKNKKENKKFHPY